MGISGSASSCDSATAAATATISDSHFSSSPAHHQASSDSNMNFSERALSAAGAAVLSAVLVNPLDVAKTRLQAQAARPPGHPTEQGRLGGRMMSIGPNRYKGTLDVFYKVTRQEGFTRLWRGTNAGLALAVPTVGIYLPCYDIFRNWIEEYTNHNAPKLTPYAPLIAGSVARSIACIVCSPIELARTRMQAYRTGAKPPGMWKTLLGVVSPLRSTSNHQNCKKHGSNEQNINTRGKPQAVQSYRLLWTGIGAQLARDVPFSAICWSTLEPIRRRLLALAGDESNAASVLGANFSAGFIAGSLAAASTCPLDVAKTRRQIEKDPTRALNMSTRLMLVEVWRDGGLKGLFTGVGPRVGRAGPSVGIVVSFYEVVKYVLHQRHSNS